MWFWFGCYGGFGGGVVGGFYSSFLRSLFGVFFERRRTC